MVMTTTRDMECCGECQRACRETGCTGEATDSPWVVSPVRDLRGGDVLREWGDGPHLTATVEIRDGRWFATWQDGAVKEYAASSGGKSHHVIRRRRVAEGRTEFASWEPMLASHEQLMASRARRLSEHLAHAEA
jgi:hypothetical protein